MSTNGLTTLASQPDAPGNLIDLYEKRDYYGVINVAQAHFKQDANSLPTAILAARSYLELGLVGPARELLSSMGDDSALTADAAELAQGIKTAKSGRLAWGRLQPRFERNIRCIYERHPSLQQHDATFRDLPRMLELYESLDGNVHVSERRTGSIRRWVRDLCDAQRLANNANLGHKPTALFCGPYLIMSDRHGLLLERVFRSTNKMFLTFTPRLYLVEPDVRLFGVAMFLSECIEAWCDERVELFVGPTAHDDLIDHFETHAGRTFPAYVLTGKTAMDASDDQTMERLQAMSDARVEHGRRMHAAVTQEYDALPTNHWHNRYSDGTPLRILGLTSRFTTYLQYSMRDCKAAFERLGHEFKLVIEENDHDLLPTYVNAEQVARFKPDLMLVIDHLRSEYAESIPANVPYVCWIQDQLPNLTSKAAGRSLGPMDFYIAPEVEQFERSYDYPAGQGMAWTMATNERTFSSEPMSEAALAAHRCDISFVSNHSKPPRIFHEEFVRSMSGSPETERLLEYLYDAITRGMIEEPRTAGVRSATSLLAQASRDIGISAATPESVDSIGRQYIHRLMEIAYRQSTLKWAADYCDRTGRTLHLYGNGWADHPRFAKYDRGFAKNGEHLRAIYQASRINLQITSYGAVHQRLLDGLAAGGFFLIRYCPTDVIHKLAQRLLDLVERHGIQPDRVYRTRDLPEVATTWQAMRKLHGEASGGLSFEIPESELVRLRGLAANGFRLCAGASFARYGEVAFANAMEFTQMADRYLNDENDRHEVVASMRPVVVDNFTYARLAANLLAFLQRRFRDNEPPRN